MSLEPYASARNVYRIVDNGSSHNGQRPIDRMAAGWPNARLVHLPVLASWLNQIEVVFSLWASALIVEGRVMQVGRSRSRLLRSRWRTSCRTHCGGGCTRRSRRRLVVGLPPWLGTWSGTTTRARGRRTTTRPPRCPGRSPCGPWTGGSCGALRLSRLRRTPGRLRCDPTDASRCAAVEGPEDLARSRMPGPRRGSRGRSGTLVPHCLDEGARGPGW
jgi:hypothetical protein